MAFTDSRLYRARALEPVLAINEIALILDQNGPIRKYGSPFMQVLGVEPVFGLGNRGFTALWTQGTITAGYSLPAGAPTGTITSGGSVQFVNPTLFQNGPRQLTQLRFNMSSTALTGVVIADIDLQIFLPGAIGRFGVLNASPGTTSSIDENSSPADAAVEPAQGAAMTQQTSPAAGAKADFSNLREIFIFENNAPTFKLINQGSASLTAGTIGIRVAGFRYDLAPIDGTMIPFSKQLVMGQIMSAPANVKFFAIPTGPFVATGSYGS